MKFSPVMGQGMNFVALGNVHSPFTAHGLILSDQLPPRCSAIQKWLHEQVIFPDPVEHGASQRDGFHDEAIRTKVLSFCVFTR